MNTLLPKSILGASLALSLTLVGCGDLKIVKADKNEENESKARIVERINVQTSSGDQIVQAAELLVDPVNFSVADSLFATALTLNPENKKAQFYKVMLKPYMLYKGILHRMRPYARSLKQEHHIDSFIRNNTLLTRVNSPLRDFMMAEVGSPITNAYDLQSFVLEQQKAFNELRVWAKANRNVKLSLALNPFVHRAELEKRVSEYCRVSEIEGQYAMDCPKALAEVQISEPDMLAMQHVAAGMVFYFNLMTSYSAENYEKAAQILQTAELNKRPVHETAEEIRALPGYLTLRKDSQIRLIDELGVDLIAGARWVMANQDLLCPGGKEENVRPGHLSTNGKCIVDQSETERALAQMNQVLAGPMEVTLFEPGVPSGFQTELDISVIWKKPIQDLKKHIPTRFNECGSGVEFADVTLEGILPNGDLNRVIDNRCN